MSKRLKHSKNELPPLGEGWGGAFGWLVTGFWLAGAGPLTILHSSPDILRRHAIRLAEGVVEARGVFKAAAAGYLVNTHPRVVLQQMSGTLHLDFHHKRGGRTARYRHSC